MFYIVLQKKVFKNHYLNTEIMCYSSMWKTPPKIKIYEALGAVSEERIKVTNDGAKVYSSSKKKFYTVTYANGKIMSNDNGSYYQSYLGYPSIALLFLKNKLPYNKEYGCALRNIYWKKLNQKHDRNKDGDVPDYDYEKVLEEVHKKLEDAGVNLEAFKKYVDKVYQEIKNSNYEMLGNKTIPPKGY